MKTKQNLLDELKLELLEIGGVDNWQWYGESLEYFYDYSEYLDTVSEEDFLAGYYQDYADFLNYKYINKHIAEAEQIAEADKAKSSIIKEQLDLAKIL